MHQLFNQYTLYDNWRRRCRGAKSRRGKSVICDKNTWWWMVFPSRLLVLSWEHRTRRSKPVHPVSNTHRQLSKQANKLEGDSCTPCLNNNQNHNFLHQFGGDKENGSTTLSSINRKDHRPVSYTHLYSSCCLLHYNTCLPDTSQQGISSKHPIGQYRTQQHPS